jgi:hypothetical protein
MPIGQANQVGKTADGLALSALRVKGADVPGRFIIVDGAFVGVESGPSRVGNDTGTRKVSVPFDCGRAGNPDLIDGVAPGRFDIENAHGFTVN